MLIRDEQAGDEAAIRAVVGRAFAGAAHASGTEADIVDALRDDGALTVSLVACFEREIVGHVAVSPVEVEDGAAGWFGLGPVAVAPDAQQRGVGAALVGEALERLRQKGAAGCVVLGDPHYYGRFGFAHDPQLRFGEVPPPYFQMLSFGGVRPSGVVRYHPAFGVD